MSTIKPPGGPGGPLPPTGPVGPEATAPASPASGPSFREVAGAASPTGTPATSATPTDPTQAVLADLRAGRLTPDQAVDRLTTLAVDKTHAPPALRPAIEQKLRALILRDPTVASLLARMGATVPPEQE